VESPMHDNDGLCATKLIYVSPLAMMQSIWTWAKCVVSTSWNRSKIKVCRV